MGCGSIQGRRESQIALGLSCSGNGGGGGARIVRDETRFLPNPGFSTEPFIVWLPSCVCVCLSVRLCLRSHLHLAVRSFDRSSVLSFLLHRRIVFRGAFRLWLAGFCCRVVSCRRCFCWRVCCLHTYFYLATFPQKPWSVRVVWERFGSLPRWCKVCRTEHGVSCYGGWLRALEVACVSAVCDGDGEG